MSRTPVQQDSLDQQANLDQQLNPSEDVNSDTSSDMGELREALQESLGKLRAIVPGAEESTETYAVAWQDNKEQAGVKGVGAGQQIKRQVEYFVVDDSIKQKGNEQDARRDNAVIAREDYGVEVTRADGKATLKFTEDNTQYPLTDATLQVGVHRPGIFNAQVNVVDQMKDGVISVDRLSVSPLGNHNQLESMKIRIAGDNPQQTLDQLEKLGIKLEPQFSRINVGDKNKITLDHTTGEVSISYDAKSGIVTIENINLPGKDGTTVKAEPGRRTAQSLTIDTKNDNRISIGLEYQVDKDGKRIAAPKTNFEVHKTTAREVDNDVSFNANPLAELKPGEVFKSKAGIEWTKDNDGNLYYNTNGNEVWGRLDREEAYTLRNGQMRELPKPEGFAEGFADDIVRARQRPGAAPVVKPHRFNLVVSDGKKVAEIFNHGFSAAQEYAQSNGYVLGYKPSGVREKSIGKPAPIDVSAMKPHAELERIELQEVWAQKMDGGKPVGDPVKLGLVRIQDKEHLTGPIASPEKIAADIHTMMKEKLGLR